MTLQRNLRYLLLFTLTCISTFVNAMDPFTCVTCSKHFTQKGHLREHITRKHTKEKLFVCSTCNKKFSIKAGLTEHKKIHEKSQFYTCNTCGAILTSYGSFKTHKRDHSEKKSYACDLCPEQFTQKNLLTNHLMRHKGERPYECDVCDMKFVTKGHLTTHNKSQTHKRNEYYNNITKLDINIADYLLIQPSLNTENINDLPLLNWIENQ